VLADLDGDGAADMQLIVTVTTAAPIDAGDFLL
jgi:hypothetical protein